MAGMARPTVQISSDGVHGHVSSVRCDKGIDPSFAEGSFERVAHSLVYNTMREKMRFDKLTSHRARARARHVALMIIIVVSSKAGGPLHIGRGFRHLVFCFRLAVMINRCNCCDTQKLELRNNCCNNHRGLPFHSNTVEIQGSDFEILSDI